MICVMEEIKLREFFQYYSRTYIVTSILVLAGLVGALVYNYVQVPLYQSSAKLLITADSDQSSASRGVMMSNYVELMQSRLVLSDVANNVDMDGLTVDDIREGLTVKNEKDTEVISLDLVTRDRARSYTIAKQLIASFGEKLETLYKTEKKSINIITAPEEPEESYNVKRIMQLAVGVGVGLLASLAVAFVRYDMKMSRKNESNDKSNNISKGNKESDKLAKKRYTAELKETDARIREAEQREAQAQANIARAQANQAKEETKAATENAKIARLEKDAAEQKVKQARAVANQAKIQNQAKIDNAKLSVIEKEENQNAVLERERARLKAKQALLNLRQETKLNIKKSKVQSRLAMMRIKADARQHSKTKIDSR